MQQYYRFKKRHPDCVLLFRVGDFYEMFDDDAVRVSQAIGLTLTQRSAGVPMAGVPHHQLENYLRRLTLRGFRVAVCEQLIDASLAKGIVPRAVTRVITPGTLVDEALLESDASVAVAAVCVAAREGKSSSQAGRPDANRAAVAIAEVSTGSFIVVECDVNAIGDELARRGVRELLFADMGKGNGPGELSGLVSDNGPLRALGVSALARPAWHFRPEEALESLRKQYGVRTLAGFGLRDDEACVFAAGALLRYLEETQTAGAEEAKEVASSGIAVRRGSLKHLRPPKKEDASGHLIIDAVSLRSLEIERTMREVGGIGGGASGGNGSGKGGVSVGGGDGTLLGVFAFAGNGKGSARTAMGKRALRDWICRPLLDIGEIERRQSGVSLFVEQRELAARVGDVLAGIQDVARIGGRVSLARATPRDIVVLAQAVLACGGLSEIVSGAPALAQVHGALLKCVKSLRVFAERTTAMCVDNPPGHMRDGGLIKDGVDATLDEARLLERDAGAWLAKYQAELIAQHDLPSLKVGYNKVAGYFIELPTVQARSAPVELKRMQTLRNAERYTTPLLSEFERKVTTAQSRALERERELFIELCDAALGEVHAIAGLAEAIATVDVLLAFADKAAHRQWVKPTLNDRVGLRIEQGRHPVLDELLGGSSGGGGCVPNDCELGTKARGHEGTEGETKRQRDEETKSHASQSASTSSLSSTPSLALLTGPNMAGKSTYIRMVALVTILAHTGSFVPAASATIGITDRVFTRIGADDALHAGQSTFMVEMVETANILHHATGRSLVILDEVGRGTSTLDGLSLAWGIVEYLGGVGEKSEGASERTSEQGRKKATTRETNDSHPSFALPRTPRTLFATHYHELTELEERYPSKIRNLQVAVREWPAGGEHAEIVFLHRILPGRADQSYGLHVARLAGMPKDVISRAREVLGTLAVHQHGTGIADGSGDRGSDVSDGAGDARNRSSGSNVASEAHASAKVKGKRGRVDVSGVSAVAAADADGQMALFKEYVPHPAVDALKELKLDAMTPLQAFDVLRKLQDKVQETRD